MCTDLRLFLINNVALLIENINLVLFNELKFLIYDKLITDLLLQFTTCVMFEVLNSKI